MRVGKIHINKHGNSSPVIFIDAGDGCLFCLNRYRSRTGRFLSRHHTKGSINLSRIIYEIKFGELSNKFDIHHKCKNKWCINIDHLEPLKKTDHRKLHKKPYMGMLFKF